MPHVNYVVVLVSAVAVFVLGWLWYSPLLFYKPWMRLRGMDPVAAMANAKMPAGTLVAEFVRCFVLAYVVAHFVRALGIDSLVGAIASAATLRLMGAVLSPHAASMTHPRASDTFHRSSQRPVNMPSVWLATTSPESAI